MGVPFHVNGPAGIYYAGALLGYSEGTVEFDFQAAHHDVMFDVAGGLAGKAGDVQFMNEDAFVSCNLAAFDWTVLKSAVQNSRAGSTPGTMPASGMLLGANGFLKPLQIVSTLDNVPHTFQTCYLVSHRPAVGTVNTIIPITFRGIAYSGNSDSLAGKQLYVYS